MKRKEFTNQEIKDISKYYLKDKYSMEKIGKIFNVSKTVIKRVLAENQIPSNLDHHKYKCDYDYFEVINSYEKAYWLGFLAADGCNYQREHNASIILNIHQQDIEHLKLFQLALKSDIPIKSYISDSGFSNNTPMCKFIINSKKMSNDLLKLGIVPKKSLILEPPKIDSKYYLSFILGYFDGDGSLYKTGQYNNYCLSFEGTKEILEWIKNILNLDNKLEKRQPNSQANNYYIRVGGTVKVYNALKIIYDSCQIHLNRKYLIYKDLETVVLARNSQ